MHDFGDGTVGAERERTRQRLEGCVGGRGREGAHVWEDGRVVAEDGEGEGECGMSMGDDEGCRDLRATGSTRSRVGSVECRSRS